VLICKTHIQLSAIGLQPIYELWKEWLRPARMSVFGLSVIAASVTSAPAQESRIEVIWRHAVKTGLLPIGCQGTPALGSDGSVYVPAGNFLYALSPDGSEKWSLGEERGITSLGDVAIDDTDTIYVGSDALRAFDRDGFLKWKIPDLGGVRDSSMAIGEDKTIYFTRRNKFCAASAEGIVKWEREVGILNGFAPVIDPDGAIYCKGGPGLAAIHAFGSDGTLKRIFSPKGAMFVPAGAAVDDLGNLYFGAVGRNFYALDKNAQLKWIFKTDATVTFAPAIGADHTIYFGCADGNLHAIDSNGKLKWRFRTGGPIYSAPAIDLQGNIYFASRDRNFYCVDFNGSLKAALPVTAGFGSPVIGIDGTIYLVDVGYVYAIRGFAPPGVGPWPMKRHDAQGTGRVQFQDPSAGTVAAEK
jgi:outer membrane protein assembly factor BamB